ncbi:hypothetical protein BHU11_07535 [Tannerella sp. oral taxon 808]|nr:hypothetical protein BHU11_07535 [Tannerella sp. oral taxon 808]
MMNQRKRGDNGDAMGQNVFGNALREFRKGQKVVFPRCGSSAKAKKWFFLVAGFPQRPKSGFFSLRDSRKGQKVVFSRCGTSADAKKWFFLVAGLPQAFLKMPWVP